MAKEIELAAKEYVVCWSMSVSAYNEAHAVSKAHDVLRSRIPIALGVKSKSAKQFSMIIPELEKSVSATIRKSIPQAEITISIDDKDMVEVSIVSDAFRDIPEDSDRTALITALFSSLPQTELDRFSFLCWTKAEHSEFYVIEDDEEDEDKASDEEDTLLTQ